MCVVAVPGSFFGALPTLKHGDVELCQSQAITMYLGEIGPKFAGLAAGHKGVDAMYTGILEDVLAGCAGVVFVRPKSWVPAVESRPKRSSSPRSSPVTHSSPVDSTVGVARLNSEARSFASPSKAVCWEAQSSGRS